MKKCQTCRYGSEYELDKPCIVYREDCPLYQKEGDEMTNNCDLISRQAVIDLISKFIIEIHSEGGRDLNAHTNDVLRQILRNVGSDRVLPSVNLQEPCDDAISRQKVLDIINFEDKWLLDAKGHNAGTEIAFSGMKSKVSALPSVNPQEPCDDAVSRQAVDDAIYDYSRSCDVNYAQIMEYIDKIPSVKLQEPKGKCLLSQEYKDWQFIQEPKTGHWKLGICDNCGYDWGKDAPIASVPNFCPNCGCRMFEPKEGEVENGNDN